MSHTSSDLRVGGVAAIAGGTGGLAGNLLHPTPPAEAVLLVGIMTEGVAFLLGGAAVA